MDIPSISLSGMQAASTQIANSANNVANANSSWSIVNGELVQEAYQPTDIIQIPVSPTGGVKTETRISENPTIQVYAPQNPAADVNGMVEMPNIDWESEFMDQQMATYTFKGSLHVFTTYSEMLRNVVDIMS